MTDPTDHRPLVTFALIAFNQEKYIGEAVESAFSQTYEPLEIILSDDFSSDKTYAHMKELANKYFGRHKVILRRNCKNLGLADHINNVMAASTGRLIVIAAGDDISVPERTSTLTNYWLSNGKFSGSIYSNFRSISEEGALYPHSKRLEPFKTKLSDKNISMLNNFSGISGCSHAWTRDVFDIFGPLNSNVAHEDVSIPLRSLLIGSVGFLPKELVYYRKTSGSITRKKFSSSNERFAKMAAYWEGRIAMFEQLSSDMDKIRKLKSVPAEDLNWLGAQSTKARKYAHQQSKLYKSKFLYRMAVSINPLSALSLRDRIKWIIISIFPIVYGKYRREYRNLPLEQR
ncbi:glycosyltransferase [Henriciella marina]|uniref:glycosyltransferase n=1 Tax=Henriciella marina TaxID=453851 RepID=UPI00038255C1|nr:glycosyltransferase [Henriciella marina]